MTEMSFPIYSELQVQSKGQFCCYALEADNDYLTEGGVFPKELLNNLIKTKRAECAELSKIPHPAEFDKYYNI